MTLSLQSQWKLVAAGLMAHADQVMTGEECERLMFLVEQDLDGQEYADWLSTISDPTKLKALFDALPELPEQDHRPVLEEAWLMAAVDGVCDTTEVQMLNTIATRLGVEPVQLEFWREAWTKAQSDRAEVTMRALGALLGDADSGLLGSALFELPTTMEHRNALQACIEQGSSDDTQAVLEDVVQRLSALPKLLRHDVVARLGRTVAQTASPEGPTEQVRALATRAGMSESETTLALAANP